MALRPTRTVKYKSTEMNRAPITVLTGNYQKQILGHDSGLSGLQLKTDNVEVIGCGVFNEICCIRFQKSREMKVVAVGQAPPHLI